MVPFDDDGDDLSCSCCSCLEATAALMRWRRTVESLPPLKLNAVQSAV